MGRQNLTLGLRPSLGPTYLADSRAANDFLFAALVTDRLRSGRRETHLRELEPDWRPRFEQLPQRDQRRALPAVARHREVIVLGLQGPEAKTGTPGNRFDRNAPVGSFLGDSSRHSIV